MDRGTVEAEEHGPGAETSMMTQGVGEFLNSRASAR